MLQVSGFIGVSGKAPVEEVRTEKGTFFNFKAASPDPDTGKVTYYNASVWVPNDETSSWRDKLKPGGTFHLLLGNWDMYEYEEGKYPIPKLKINRSNLKPMAVPYWYKTEEKK